VIVALFFCLHKKEMVMQERFDDPRFYDHVFYSKFSWKLFVRFVGVSGLFIAFFFFVFPEFGLRVQI